MGPRPDAEQQLRTRIESTHISSNSMVTRRPPLGLKCITASKCTRRTPDSAPHQPGRPPPALPRMGLPMPPRQVVVDGHFARPHWAALVTPHIPAPPVTKIRMEQLAQGFPSASFGVLTILFNVGLIRPPVRSPGATDRPSNGAQQATSRCRHLANSSLHQHHLDREFSSTVSEDTWDRCLKILSGPSDARRL
jgi:hypothetical protein